MRTWSYIGQLLMLLGFASSLLAKAPTAPPDTSRGELYGAVVVIDPGHGGSDPGAKRKFNGATVAENEYVFDIAQRLGDLIRLADGITVFTVLDPHTPRINNFPAQTIIPDDKDEYFNTAKRAKVNSRISGLKTRVSIADATKRRYPKHWVVGVSIHFDAIKRRKELQGTRLIVPKGRTASSFTLCLQEAFADSNQLRSENPVVENGDRRYGIRNLYILRVHNDVEDWALIELGNFDNEADLWRLRNPQDRQEYAVLIFEGIKRYVKLLRASR